MEKDKFYKIAQETGSHNCIYFNWSLSKKTNCWKEDDKFCSCKMFNGEECKEFVHGI